MKIKTEVLVVVVGERERKREGRISFFSQNFRGLIMISRFSISSNFTLTLVHLLISKRSTTTNKIFFVVSLC